MWMMPLHLHVNQKTNYDDMIYSYILKKDIGEYCPELEYRRMRVNSRPWLFQLGTIFTNIVPSWNIEGCELTPVLGFSNSGQYSPISV